jgi:hypothetical protein
MKAALRSSAVIAKPPTDFTSTSICVRTAARVEPAGKTYTPSRSTAQPLSFNARQTRIRMVELRAGRLRINASSAFMVVIVITIMW